MCSERIWLGFQAFVIQCVFPSSFLIWQKIKQSRVNVCLTQNITLFIYLHGTYQPGDNTHHNNLPQLTCQPNYEDDAEDDDVQ